MTNLSKMTIPSKNILKKYIPSLFLCAGIWFVAYIFIIQGVFFVHILALFPFFNIAFFYCRYLEQQFEFSFKEEGLWTIYSNLVITLFVPIIYIIILGFGFLFEIFLIVFSSSWLLYISAIFQVLFIYWYKTQNKKQSVDIILKQSINESRYYFKQILKSLLITIFLGSIVFLSYIFSEYIPTHKISYIVFVYILPILMGLSLLGLIFWKKYSALSHSNNIGQDAM